MKNLRQLKIILILQFIFATNIVYGCSTPVQDLMDAVQENNLEKAIKAFQDGATINDIKQNGFSSLLIYSALNHGNFEIFKLLIEKGDDVNAATKEGWTVLMAVVQEEDIDKVKLLLSKEVSINPQNNAGLTALMVAVNHRNIEMIKLLLRSGADINTKDKIGYSALAEIFTHKNGSGNIGHNKEGEKIDVIYVNPEVEYAKDNQICFEIAKLLIANGADINSRTNRGKTILKMAADEQNVELVNYLKSKGAIE